MNPLNRREWLVRLTHFAAVVISPIERLMPALSKTKPEPKHGIVFDGVDELIQLTTPDQERTELARILPADSFWMVVTEKGIEVWNGEGFVVSNHLMEQSPTLVEVEGGRRGIRFIESEMTVIETPKLKAEVS